MSLAWLRRLGGLALILGGTLGAVAHILHLEAPHNPAQLAHYAHLSQPIHLLLFAGGVLVLLGWFAQFALQASSTGVVGLLAFLLVFLGILFADLLHCVLEFSIFPLLIDSVPYATFALAEKTYQATPLALLQNAGQVFVLLGVPMAGYSIARGRTLPRWSAVPFFVTTIVMMAAFVPWTSAIIGPHFVTALYLTMLVLGVAVMQQRGTN